MGYQIGRVLQPVIGVALVIGMIIIPSWPARLICLAVGGAVFWRVVTQTGIMVRCAKVGDQSVEFETTFGHHLVVRWEWVTGIEVEVSGRTKGDIFIHRSRAMRMRVASSMAERERLLGLLEFGSGHLASESEDPGGGAG